MNDDLELLRAYAGQGSEAAFETLVNRYVDLVYSAALRQVRQPPLAEEITQTVFLILARKAGAIHSQTIVPGWLYRTTRYTAAAAMKLQCRREQREQEAHMQSLIQDSQGEPDWEQFSPVLDDAMAQLRERDRDAIILRYFQNKPLRDVGAALGVDEYAAQKRVSRALEKLHRYLAKRGISSTSAAFAGAMTVHSVQAAPAALAKTVTAAALAKGAVTSTSTLTLIKGALKIMAWTKAKTAAAAGIILILAAGTTSVVVKNHHPQQVKSQWTMAETQMFEAETARRVNDSKMADLACFLFADAHQGQWPKSFAQLNNQPSSIRNMDSNWEFVSGGNRNRFNNPSQTILFREKQSRPGPDGKFIKIYALADGSVQTVGSPEADFQAMEKKFGFSVQPAAK